jgi:hypothetical protein
MMLNAETPPAARAESGDLPTVDSMPASKQNRLSKLKSSVDAKTAIERRIYCVCEVIAIGACPK